jgi:hypothetical protein
MLVVGDVTGGMNKLEPRVIAATFARRKSLTHDASYLVIVLVDRVMDYLIDS